MEDYYKAFIQLAEKIFEEYKIDYLDKIHFARNKERRHNKIFNKRNDDFMKFQNGMSDYRNFYYSIDELYEDDNRKEWSEWFNHEFIKIDSNKRDEAIKMLGEFEGNKLFFKFLGKEREKFEKHSYSIEEPQQINVANMKWKGTEPELVQLAYSLFEANLLTNDKEEVTYLVKQLAEAFNFNLGKNWQSTLSKNIKQRKYFDKPPIFDKISDGYRTYYDRIMNKK